MRRLLTLSLALLPAFLSAAANAARVDFNRDVRPILSDHCFACHGFDEAKRKAGLRLDLKEEAFKGGKSGKPAIVAGKVEASELYRRIVTADADDHMPPAEFGKPLSAAQVATLKQWVAEGAEFKGHWAFLAPEHPTPPTVKDTAWPRTPIDHFVLARLEENGLKPRPEADKATLIRRATLDLTGLPPTTDEIDAFLADSSGEAYEKVVDRLLASARYGERMAVDWLDAARFADTHGYHIDSARDMTAWRDWVIGAFNRNQPFDQFTIEQIAGDLLPNPTKEQKVASGFNRNHMINYEGGAIPDEYHTAYVMDRINTTATVWLGLTMACAQCHDHKYDPLTMRDYYRFYAFFNTIADNGLDGRNGNAVPLLKLPDESQEAELARRTAAIRTAEAQLNTPPPAIDAAQERWEAEAADERRTAWSPVELVEFKSSAGATLAREEDNSVFVSGANPEYDTFTITFRSTLPEVTGLRLEAMADERLPSKGPGRYSSGNIGLSDVKVSAGGTPLKLKAATADHSQQDYPIRNAIDGDAQSAWAIQPQVGKPHFAVFEPEQPVKTVDGATTWTVALDFRAFSQHTIGRFRLTATGAREPAGLKPLPDAVKAALAVAAGARTDEQRATLRNHFRNEVSSDYRKLKDAVAAARKSRDEFDRGIRTAMVMSEQDKPRDTFMLVRGDYDKKGEKVGAGTPAALPPLREDMPANRLGLARWLVSPEQPLTARVTVNRYWQMYFGAGLVKSAENFGSQGDWPTHPELLDWLATEFVRSGWDVKALQKRIVMSATYRQSSAAPRDQVEADPENRLLARGPRVRLQAEFIRDLALSVSGLLNPKIGGESVLPYQPSGLWEELMAREDGDNFTAQKYVQDRGPKLYRRSMYTFVKRTSAHPNMTTFDAPDRQVCTVRRPRTNTPLQALVLLNDPTYVEAARKLAENTLLAETDDRRRIALAFRQATGRAPKAAEIEVLLKLQRDQAAVFRADRGAAGKLVSVGEAARAAGIDTAELAAWTMVTSAILNLDETITKG